MNVYIYTLKVIDGKVHIRLIQNTLGIYEKSMHLGLISDSQFCWIKKLNTLCHFYPCDWCGSMFNRVDDLTRHKPTCGDKEKLPKFPFTFTRKVNVISSLNATYRTNYPVLYPYLITFDFQAMSQRVDIEAGNKLTFKSRQTQRSFSVFSNVPAWFY